MVFVKQFNVGNGSLWLGDCLELMRSIPDGSVDMVLCDLPYGTTACKWDVIIPFEALWREYWRICKPNAAVILTASQPFTSALIMSDAVNFRYCWVWDKVNRYTGALLANKMPLKRHEDIAVFYKKLPVYNKQYREGKAYTRKRGGHKTGMGEFTTRDIERVDTVNTGQHNPCSVLEIKGDEGQKGVHPTQKPVALFDYLIRTYTNPGDLVLDNCSGSGTTAVAAQAAGRRWLCIEKDPAYYYASCGRVWKACQS
jgi:site-specific DNA-methyltransferase (adenine-specific)